MAQALTALISSMLMGSEILWLKFFGSNMEPGPIPLLMPIIFFGGSAGAVLVAATKTPRILNYALEIAAAGLILSFLSVPHWIPPESIQGVALGPLFLAFVACVLWGTAQTALIQAAKSPVAMLAGASIGALPLVAMPWLLDHYSLGTVAGTFTAVHLLGLCALSLRRRPLRQRQLWQSAAYLALAPIPFFFQAQSADPIYSNSIATIRVRASNQPPRKIAGVSQANSEFSKGTRQLPFKNSRIYRNGKYVTDLIDADTLHDVEILKRDELYGYIEGVNPGRAALIGTGGGREILQARLAGFKSIYAIEINPDMVRAVREHSRNPALTYGAPEVTTVVADGRDFFRTLDKSQLFDLILLSDVRNYGATLSLHFAENYLLTDEALATYVKHLAPRGLLLYRMRGREKILVNSHFSSAMNTFKSLSMQPEDEIAIVRRKKDHNAQVNSFIIGLRRGGFSAQNREQIQVYNQRVQFKNPAMLSFPDAARRLTDDRPYPYWTKSSASPTWFLPLALVAILLFAVRRTKANSLRTLYGAGLMTGLAYVAVQILMVEQTVFQSGDPIHSPPLVLGATILASALGYFYTMHFKKPSEAFLACTAAVTVLIGFYALKNFDVLPLSSLARAALGAAIGAAPLFFASAAYARILNAAHDRRKTAQFLAANGAGLLLGGLGSKLIAVEFGATALAIACALIYVCAAVFAAKLFNMSQFDIQR